MKRRSILLVATFFGLSVLATGAAYAGTQAKDEMVLNSPKYKDSVVNFSHKKHHEEYKLECGECHHDAEHKPLNDLKAGDDVHTCDACHKTDAEQKKAFHDNCKGCHVEAKKAGNANAPTSCKECHQNK